MPVSNLYEMFARFGEDDLQDPRIDYDEPVVAGYPHPGNKQDKRKVPQGTVPPMPPKPKPTPTPTPAPRPRPTATPYPSPTPAPVATPTPTPMPTPIPSTQGPGVLESILGRGAQESAQRQAAKPPTPGPAPTPTEGAVAPMRQPGFWDRAGAAIDRYITSREPYMPQGIAQNQTVKVFGKDVIGGAPAPTPQQQRQTQDEQSRRALGGMSGYDPVAAQRHKEDERAARVLGGYSGVPDVQADYPTTGPSTIAVGHAPTGARGATTPPFVPRGTASSRRSAARNARVTSSAMATEKPQTFAESTALPSPGSPKEFERPDEWNPQTPRLNYETGGPTLTPGSLTGRNPDIGATRPRRVTPLPDSKDPEAAKQAIQIMTDSLGGSNERSRYYNAEKQYMYKNELIHGDEKHKGWKGRFLHGLMGAGMGLAAGAQPDSRGHYDMGRMLGAAGAGAAFGGIRPGSVDTAYNKMYIEPEAERQRAKQLANENIEFEKRKRELGMTEEEAKIAGLQGAEARATAAEGRVAGMYPANKAAVEAATKHTEASTKQIEKETRAPKDVGEYIWDPSGGKDGLGGFIYTPSSRKGTALDPSALAGDMAAFRGGTKEERAEGAASQAGDDKIHEAMKLVYGEAETNRILSIVQAGRGAAGVQPAGRGPSRTPGKRGEYFQWGPNKEEMDEEGLQDELKKYNEYRAKARDLLKSMYIQDFVTQQNQGLSQMLGGSGGGVFPGPVAPRQAGQASAQVAQQQQGSGAQPVMPLNSPKLKWRVPPGQ